MIYEREFEVGYAKKILTKKLNKLNIEYSMKNKKSINGKANICEIKDKYTNEYISVGKGLSIECEVGALAEAIEHHYFENYNPNAINVDTDEIIKINKNVLKEIPFKLLVKCKYKNISSIVFEDDMKNVLFYPKCFVFPTTENMTSYKLQCLIKKYISNNGMSVGVTLTESKIHSINELVERHALSIHIINMFFTKRGKAFLFKKESFPKYIIELIHDIEETIGSNILILDISVFENFPVILAVATPKENNGLNFLVPIWGSGCSLSIEYAITRALTELYQCFEVYDLEDYYQDKQKIINFKQLNEYYNTVNFKYKENMLNIKKYKENCNVPIECKNILKKQIELLNLNGYIPYYHIIDNQDIYCIKTIIPGFQSFHKILHGNLIVPNEVENGNY